MNPLVWAKLAFFSKRLWTKIAKIGFFAAVNEAVILEIARGFELAATLFANEGLFLGVNESYVAVEQGLFDEFPLTK